METLKFLLLLSSFLSLARADQEQPWVWLDPDSDLEQKPRLSYRSTWQGDRIMDFSAVGYRGGMDPIPPAPPVKVTLFPGGGGSSDDTEALQAAINTVSAMQLDEQGFRGTVKLAKGTFNLGKKSIVINTSGVVIDGSGVDQTLIDAHSLEAQVLFRIHGNPATTVNSTRSPVVETVPSGSKTLRLSSVAGFSEGDQVSITWTWSPQWIQMMNMSDYWRPGYGYKAERIIKTVSTLDSSIQLDIPLPFRMDMNYLDEAHGASVEKISTAPRIARVALQNFKAVKNITFPGTGCFLKMQDVEDAWITDLELHDFSGTILKYPRELLHTSIAIAGTRVTAQNLVLHRTANATKGPKPFDIALHRPGQQILVRNVTISGNREYSFITGDSIAGPNVFHNCTGFGANTAQPHMRFATGLLYDNLRIPDGGIEMINRRWFGSGHGIAAGFSVAWNTESKSLQVISSPGAANWALGCRAQEVNDKIQGISEPGFVDAVLDPRIPSLFLAQRHAAGMPAVF
ncbi:hypothetical protein SELMODRAFT_407052 [Selaginella moellendorffii]|uniref:Pectate lyase superfamily protein domain-containing protein n=1 Tax=Selaginella moellendorffii TaxID=88036 RepID=D8R3S0_SELML|nr:hypothetical protein SELMODRAFT_407052 [Selaginella moellendorffii]